MEEKDLREQDEEHSQKKTSADSSELVPSVDDPSADYDSGEKKNEPVAEKKQEAKPPKKKSHIREWVEALVFAFAGVLILKTFVFEPFAIPSDSMDATLETGDYIVVNKLAYGPRLPMTPLTIPFTHQTIGGMKSYLEWFSFPYMRLPGYSSVKRNDVLVFNFPAEDLFPLNGKPVNYP
ncbi:MAG TPA: signal peptidase I, partial [Bacteroidia bacterium]|nr:signal peptidase I [Bacteroidia bacterium]